MDNVVEPCLAASLKSESFFYSTGLTVSFYFLLSLAICAAA